MAFISNQLEYHAKVNFGSLSNYSKEIQSVALFFLLLSENTFQHQAKLMTVDKSTSCLLKHG